MIRFQRVLCPVDLSETSGEALRHARAIAAWYDATLTILEVVAVSDVPMAYAAATGGAMPPFASAEEREAAVQSLATFAGVERASDRVTVVLREGAVVPQVIEEAIAGRADLIVIGTHGRSGFDRLLLGSVTEKIIRRAPCPVLTIPPAAAGRAALADAPLFAPVLCAVDFSPASRHALEYALSLAQEAQAALILLHVLEGTGDEPSPGSRSGDEWRRRREQAVEALRRAVPDEARVWCRPEEIVEAGRAHEQIVRVADDRGAGVIVLGVHGRSLTHTVFFGSTATQVVRHARQPVLSIRPVALDH